MDKQPLSPKKRITEKVLEKSTHYREIDSHNVYFYRIKNPGENLELWHKKEFKKLAKLTNVMIELCR